MYRRETITRRLEAWTKEHNCTEALRDMMGARYFKEPKREYVRVILGCDVGPWGCVYLRDVVAGCMGWHKARTTQPHLSWSGTWWEVKVVRVE